MTAVPHAVVHPPVAHGDLLRLGLGHDETVVIIDGHFHQVPSLRHKEILWILAKQVRVIGCSSLGALRSAELWEYGMVGNGAVFQMYRDGVIDADDEVAVAHGEGPEYRKFGMPLVNIRHAVAMAERNGVVTCSEAADIVTVSRGLNYTSRSWRAIRAALTRDDARRAGAVDRIRGFLVEHPEHADIKAADAIDTLNRLGEFVRYSSFPGGNWVDSPVWKNRMLHEWCAEFSGSSIDGIHVSHSGVMRFQQVYREDFPRRWSTFALRGVRSGARLRTADPPDGAVEAAALAVAAEHGIDQERLTPDQRAEWLTPQEITELTPEAALRRILVRAYRPPRGVFDLVAAEPELVTDPTARTAVAESARVNSEIASWGPRQGIEYLKSDVLQEHLRAVWGATDEPSLVAAARDRGFGSVVEAVEAVRPFYLRHHVAGLDPALAAVRGS